MAADRLGKRSRRWSSPTRQPGRQLPVSGTRSGGRTESSVSACGIGLQLVTGCDAEGAPESGGALGPGQAYLKTSLIFSPACLTLPLA